MTQKEITKLRVIDQTNRKEIIIREAAELLNLKQRQMLKLKNRVWKHTISYSFV